MQRLVYFIIAVLISTYAFSQEYTDEINNLKGKPVRVDLKFKKGMSHENSDWHYLYTLYDSGKIKVQKNYERGKLRAEYHYKYDSKGNKISEISIGVGNHKNDTPELYISDYTFDKPGNIKTEILKNQDKIMWLRDSIVYNNSNLPVKYIKVFPPWVEKGQTRFEYYTLTYNDKSLVEEIDMIENDGGYKKYHYWYYDNGEISKLEVNQAVVLKSDTRFIGINNDRASGKKVIEYFYKYDKYGNWIKRYTRVNDSQKQLEIKRLIKYNKFKPADN